MPKIALVHDFLTASGGAERVLKSLHEIFPEAPIFTLISDPKVVNELLPKADIRTSYLQRSIYRNFDPLLLMQIPEAIESFDFSGFNIVISSSGAHSHGIITGPETKHICYCHTPTRFLWDWHSEYLKERGITGTFKTWIAQSLLSKIRIWDKISAKRVDIWLANSQTVADRIKKYYRVDSKVVFPPVDSEFLDPSKIKFSKKDFAITVSRLSKYKRIDTIIEACALQKMPLKIIGTGSDEARLKEFSRTKGYNVEFLGYTSDESKRQLLAEARCFIFAAEDDFGIVPVEAMLMGTPVIALKKGGARETVQEGISGLFFDEPTTLSMAEAIEKFEKKVFSAERIRKEALKFSSQAFQEKIQAIVNAN